MHILLSGFVQQCPMSKVQGPHVYDLHAYDLHAGTSADFTKPFISQLKVSGGGPIPGIGSQNSLASFSSMTFKPLKVCLPL